MVIELKSLHYGGKVIFEKLILSHFDRIPKKSAGETEACFMYVQEGSFQFRTPERLLQLNTGDGALVKCNSYFFEQTKIDHKNNVRSKGIGIYLYPSMIKELFDFDLSISDFETDYDATIVNIDLLMHNFMASIEFLLDNPSVSNDSMVKVKLKEFILLISKTENAPSLLDFLSSLFKPRECNFKTVVDQNLYANLSVAELALLCGMSISTFQRTFNNVFKQTPAKYILEQRMLKAKILLSDRSKRISEIAFECGYQSISTFNRLFKNSFNYSPSAFRMNQIEH
ncbi:MAG: helix-turn-helix domain-containing protein [Saprospiraceae bacterium]